MARILVLPSARVNDPFPAFCVQGEAFHHAVHVQRVVVGEHISIMDGSPNLYDCIVEELNNDNFFARIVSQTPLAAEPHIKLHLYCSLLKGEKMDWILQKVTELGVASIGFFESVRSIVRLPHKAPTSKPDVRMDRRLQRWRSIVNAACLQSGRAHVPEMIAPLSFARVLENLSPNTPTVMLWEGAADNSFSETLRSFDQIREIALIIGPEGGFTQTEATLAVARGCTLASLGKRILRAETAAIAACAIALHHFGDLG